MAIQDDAAANGSAATTTAVDANGDVGSNTTTKAHFVFIPLMFQGHLIPATDTALLLASHGAVTSILVTPSNTRRIRPAVDFARKSGLPVRLVELPLDTAAEGLPFDADDVEKVPAHLWRNYFRAQARLRGPLERHLRSHAPYPTCIVADFCHPWARDLASALGVPRLCFFSICAFTLLCQHNVERFGAYAGVADANELVVVPGLERTRSRLVELARGLEASGHPFGNLRDVSALVVAFRGTMPRDPTFLGDARLNLRILVNEQHCNSLFGYARERVRGLLDTVHPSSGSGGVWLAGHSLASYRVKDALGKTILRPQMRHMEDLVQKLSPWVPELYVHQRDLFYKGFIEYFEQRQELQKRLPNRPVRAPNGGSQLASGGPAKLQH